MGLLGKMEWVSRLTAKGQLGLIWGGIKKVLLPLGCSQCGCSCLRSPGNLLILLLFLIWQFRRKRHQWFPAKQDGSHSMVPPFLFPPSPYFPERAQSWKGALFHKKEEKEEEEQEDEEEKEEDLLRQMRLDPQWYFHPRKMEAEQKAFFFQTENLGMLNEEGWSPHPSLLGPQRAYQPFVGSKEFPVKTVIPELMPNSHYIHSPTGLTQAPTSLCPPSTSSVKAKGNNIQLFWGLPSLHSESLGATLPKSGCTFPTGTTNQQPPSDTPFIFFNEFSYLPLPKVLVKNVPLSPPYLPSMSPLPVLHGNSETTDMASVELPNQPQVQRWASESQIPILDPLLPLLSPPPSPVKPQEVYSTEVTKAMTADEHEVPGPQDIQQSELPCPPESPAQTLSLPSVFLPELQGPVEDPEVIVSEALMEDQWQTQFPQDPDSSAPTLNASPPYLLKPQGTGFTGAWSETETTPLNLHKPKASCYNSQQSEFSWAAGTPAPCLSLHTPPGLQGTGHMENPLMLPHALEFPWYNMQEKKPPCPAGPPALGLNMSSQSELQGASSIDVPKVTVPSWDRMQTQPSWTSVLSASPQAEPQGANSEESCVPLASPELPGWGIKHMHPPCTLRHNTPSLEGKEVPLVPPQIPDLQPTHVPEPQSLSQYKIMAATKRSYMHRRARQGGSEKSELPGPDKSQAKAVVPSRKRERSRKPKTRDQGGGDTGWGTTAPKRKSHSSEAKKLTSHPPARRSLVSPNQESTNLCLTAPHPEPPQPSPKTETSQVLPSQAPAKGQGGGDYSVSPHQQNRSQGGPGGLEGGKEREFL